MTSPRWLGLVLVSLVVSAGVAERVAAQSPILTHPRAPTLDTRRCASDYSEEEIVAIRAGEDGYEPDDCMLLANLLTGPQLHFFCAPADEDWAKFVARSGIIYQITAAPRANYATQPRLELMEADRAPIAQNDHFFENDAGIWWWNDGGERVVYVRVAEIANRAECGNDEYTLTLRAFTEKP